VLTEKVKFKQQFECDEVGELKEYVGCKIDYKPSDGTLKITQPVLIQSFTDEFKLPSGDFPNTPAVPGEVLHRGKPDDQVSASDQSKYRSGVGKLIHLMKWSRVEALNSVRELSRFMTGANGAHVAAMFRAMKYCVGTPERGLLLKPNMEWNGDPNFEFVIHGVSDSDFAKDPETRRSVSGYATFLCGAPVTMKSSMQNCVTLSVTEAELVSATNCAQHMMFNMRIVESMGLKVKKPMTLWVDNKGAIDLVNNWSVGGRTRHVDVRYYFLREMKEAGIIEVKWIPTNNNCSDIFTKNLDGPAFKKHAEVYCGKDKYM
jgi:hypothetical protein